MTPWAELLLNPITATDLTVRHRYHELARGQHPDRVGADGKPGPRWHVLTTAYSLVKTKEVRFILERHVAGQARLCGACNGQGVTVRRFGAGKGVAVCAACEGEGQTLRPMKVKPAPRFWRT